MAGSAGCGSTGGNPVGNAVTNAGVGGQTAVEVGQGGRASGDVSAGGAAPVGHVPEAVWDEHSKHLAVSCFAYFEGSMKFSADRTELSAEQLQLLDGLRSTAAGENCPEDVPGCQVAITSDEGDVINYASNEGDGSCGRATPLLSYASLEPFVGTLGCKFAKGDAAALPPSTGCLHGFFAGGGGVIHQQLALSEANRSYHFELDNCADSTRGAGRVTAQLMGADPAVPLAVGTAVADPGPNGTCLAFDLEVHAPLTADLVITTTKSFGPGDFYLQFR